MEGFDALMDELTDRHGDRIVSIILMGSKKGLEDPGKSDIDLLVICEKTEDVSPLEDAVRFLEKEEMGIEHGPLTRIVHRHFLGGPAFTGIDLMVVPMEELGEDFRPRSLRLNLVTRLLLSRSLFLYKVRQQGEVLYGEDLLDKIEIPRPGIRDRLLTFTFALLILLGLPWTGVGSRDFKILCFKAARYYQMNIESYLRLVTGDDTVTVRDTNLDTEMIDLAEEYRYRPEDYNEPLFLLYFRSWYHMLRNLPFLWRGEDVLR